MPRAADKTLTAARTDAADDPTEWRELTLGLALAYAGRYRKSSPARASADGIRVGGSNRPAELAETVLDELVERQEIGSFLMADDCAAGLVASLVSGDHHAAQLWLRQFHEHPETSPADIERLSELIDSAWPEEHTDVVAELRHRLLRRDMEPEIVVPQPAPSDQLEAVFGEQRFVTPFWFKSGVNAAESVACIRHDDDAIATSFVLRGGDLRPEWGDDLVLLSNSYVITADPAVWEQLAFSVPPVESLRVQFTAHGTSNNREHRIAELLFSSPPDQLDVTVCRLDPPAAGVRRQAAAPGESTAVAVQSGVPHRSSRRWLIAVVDRRKPDRQRRESTPLHDAFSGGELGQPRIQSGLEGHRHPSCRQPAVATTAWSARQLRRQRGYLNLGHTQDSPAFIVGCYRERRQILGEHPVEC